MSFEDAALVFADENRIEQFDEEHSDFEDRYINVGLVKEILFVVYTEGGEALRLITARVATPNERSEYYACATNYL